MKKTRPNKVILTPEFIQFVTKYVEQYARAFNQISQEMLLSAVPQLVLHGPLAQEFGKEGLNYAEDFSPLINESYRVFVGSLANRNAVAEVEKAIRKRLRRYRLAVQLLTEDTAPFPAELKVALKGCWGAFEGYDYTAEILKIVRQHIVDDRPVLSGTKLKKSLHKHPGWHKLEQQLFQRLTEKGLSVRKASSLTARVAETLLPNGFDATYKADTVRLRVKRPAR